MADCDGGGFGHTGVDGHDQRHRHDQDHVPRGVKLATRPPQDAIASSATKTSSRLPVCEPGARIPSVCQSPASAKPGALNGIAKCRTCHPSSGSSNGEDVTSTSPLGEPLAKGFHGRSPGNHCRCGLPNHSIPSNRWHPSKPARARLPRPLFSSSARPGRAWAWIVCCCRNQFAGALPQPAPSKDNNVAELTEKRAHRAVVHSAAAKLLRNQRREKLSCCFQNVIMAGDKDIGGIALGGALGELWADDLYNSLQVKRWRHGTASRCLTNSIRLSRL